MTSTERSEVVSSFTIIKGAMISETYEVLANWDFEESKKANLDRLHEQNYIGASSTTWLRDVAKVLNRRLAPNGRDRPLAVLAGDGLRSGPPAARTVPRPGADPWGEGTAMTDYGYGLWVLAVVNAVIFIAFAAGFFHPANRRGWKAMGVAALAGGGNGLQAPGPASPGGVPVGRPKVIQSWSPPR